MSAGRAPRFVAGIDVGSLSADAVIMDEERNLVSWAVLPTGHDSRAAGEAALVQALASAGLEKDSLAALVATGYSRELIGRGGQGKASTKTEISCHARGAALLFPGTRTVIDIGGQDSKAISIAEGGQVLDFAMNDKCAAGTGRFLEVMSRALNIELADLGQMAALSVEKVSISSTCTVFGESEVVGLISQGKGRADIAAAVCRSIAHRASALVERVGIRAEVVMTGGVAKNQAVVAALSRELGCAILVPEEPQIVGAIGAALFALAEAEKERISHRG